MPKVNALLVPGWEEAQIAIAQSSRLTEKLHELVRENTELRQRIGIPIDSMHAIPGAPKVRDSLKRWSKGRCVK